MGEVVVVALKLIQGVTTQMENLPVTIIFLAAMDMKTIYVACSVKTQVMAVAVYPFN